MNKHYFLQNLTTSTIYHLDLSEFYSYVDYCSILSQTFRISDLDLLCVISKKDISLDSLAYHILKYSFAYLTGFNQRAFDFKCEKSFIKKYVPDISIVHNAIKNFKPFYKLIKSDNYYGITCFKNSSNHNSRD